MLEGIGEVVEASCSVGGGHHPHTLLLLADGTVRILNLGSDEARQYICHNHSANLGSWVQMQISHPNVVIDG